MGDLLNKLGNKGTATATGAGNKPEPSGTSQAAPVSSDMGRGEDLLGKANPSGAAASAGGGATSSAATGTDPNASGSADPTGANADGWTAESTIKEVKKLREENKAYRIKYQEQLEQVRIESEARIAKQAAEMEALRNAQAELDKIKAEQEDKKRDLAEKVAHREAKLAETQTLLQIKEREHQRQLAEMQNQLGNYKAQAEAEASVYKSRLEEELQKIPEKFRDHASLLVKGAGDPRDALTAITEAKLKGMFEDKTVIVNHSVPNAYDGARSTQERLQESEKARRSSMNSSQKIGEALKSIKSGNPNSVFRTKN